MAELQRDRRSSTLAHHAKPGRYGAEVAGAELLLHEELAASVWNLQGSPRDGAFCDALRSVLGVELATAHQARVCGPWTLMWQGPTSWLLVAAEVDAVERFERTRDALLGSGGALFDVSSGRVLVRASGASAAQMLAKGCSIDLGPRAFPVGECRSTMVARVGALLLKHDDTPAFTVFMPRSYGEHFWQWLTASSAQYGYRVASARRFAFAR